MGRFWFQQWSFSCCFSWLLANVRNFFIRFSSSVASCNAEDESNPHQFSRLIIIITFYMEQMSFVFFGYFFGCRLFSVGCPGINDFSPPQINYRKCHFSSYSSLFHYYYYYKYYYYNCNYYYYHCYYYCYHYDLCLTLKMVAEERFTYYGTETDEFMSYVLHISGNVGQSRVASNFQ